MFRRISKLLLLGALLTAFVASISPAFASSGGCLCFRFKKGGNGTEGCHFDKKTSQCINTGCGGVCF